MSSVQADVSPLSPAPTVPSSVAVLSAPDYGKIFTESFPVRFRQMP